MNNLIDFKTLRGSTERASWIAFYMRSNGFMETCNVSDYSYAEAVEYFSQRARDYNMHLLHVQQADPDL